MMIELTNRKGTKVLVNMGNVNFITPATDPYGGEAYTEIYFPDGKYIDVLEGMDKLVPLIERGKLYSSSVILKAAQDLSNNYTGP